MPASKTRFVTACQQLLALGLVLAVLTPAASVISLDVVHDRPSAGAHQPAAAVGLSAFAKETQRASTVPTQVVDPVVTEVPLTPAADATASERAAVEENVESSTPARRGGSSSARSKSELLAAEQALTSEPAPVAGYGAVGVTWEHGSEVADDEITVQVRTRSGETWSEWHPLEYHDEHGPDPSSPEGRDARPGTDPLLVGEVDDVQVRAETTTGALPTDLRMAVIDPGAASETAQERPALDTGAGDAGATDNPGDTGNPADSGDSAQPVVADPQAGAEQAAEGSDALALQAAIYTPRPQIYSRAQWGADERLRDKGSLRYYEVHAGFVHHTVNANDYTRAQVPGIIRSIYAYHTKSRGWSDLGYNFLVDRFGRIWEGRAGGIDRPVVGAHTQGYNDYSFAMSAIGNFDIKKPSNAMVQAYGALFAWKLSLHGVAAGSGRQAVGSRSFPAINGHRDAGSTACPGRYLYARIPDIRRLAVEAQRGWAGRELESNLTGTPHPDLLVRRASDKRLFVLRTGGLTAFRAPVAAASGIPAVDQSVASPDLTGDGIADLVSHAPGAAGTIRPGTSAGAFGPARSKPLRGLRNRALLAAVGDLNGDGHNDLLTKVVKTGRIDVLLGRGDGTFKIRRTTLNAAGHDLWTSAGDSNGDGRADLIVRDTAKRLWLLPGVGGLRFGAPVRIPGSWSNFSTISGTGDFDGDGRGDLFLRKASTGEGVVRLARGNGRFGGARGPLREFVGQGAVVGVAQLAGDQTPDVVLRSGTRVSVATNTGGTESRGLVDTGLNVPRAVTLLNAGDWDRDGRGDLITRSASGVLHLRRGDGTGRFGKAIRIGTGFKSVRLLAAVGDMTGDGWPDLMGQPAGGAMRIYPGAGLSGFRASYVAYRAISATEQVPVGRWNGDGAPDTLVRSGSRVSMYAGNGPGGLTGAKALSLNVSPYDWVVGISDIELTGHADLVVRHKKNGRLYVISATATSFAKRRLLEEGMAGFDLAG